LAEGRVTPTRSEPVERVRKLEPPRTIGPWTDSWDGPYEPQPCGPWPKDCNWPMTAWNSDNGAGRCEREPPRRPHCRELAPLRNCRYSRTPADAWSRSSPRASDPDYPVRL